MKQIALLLCLSLALLFGADPIDFTDNFSAPGPKLGEAWDLLSGAFPLGGGKLLARGDRGAGWAVIRGVPELEAFEYTAALQIVERAAASGYATAGIGLYLDGANHWRLQFVEGPDKKRYFELGETLSGVWQAHSSGPNKLRSADITASTWEYGKAYLAKISLSAQGIAAEITEADGGKLVARYKYFWDNAKAVTFGRPGLTTGGLTAELRSVKVSAERPAPSASGIALEDGKAGRCAIFAAEGRGALSPRVALLSKIARGAGFGVTLLDADEISRPKVLSPANFDLLMVPDPRFPAPAREPLLRFLRNGGHGVLLGGRAFGALLHPLSGKWVGGAEIERALSGLAPSSPLFDLSVPAAWERSSDKKDEASACGIEGGALRIDLKGYTQWDTFMAPLPRKISKDAPLIVLSMKGEGASPQVAVELDEADGSRWIATVDLSPEMKRYVLLPGRFKAWDTKAKEKAGLAMERVAKISFGLAGTHTPRVSRGDHTLWIGAIGTAEDPFKGVDLNTEIALPLFGEDDDSTLTGATAVRGAEGAPIPAPDLWKGSVGGLSAVGFAIPNESISVPLLEAVDGLGRKRGYAAAMLLHIGGGYRGGAWLYSGITNDVFYEGPAFAAFLARALPAMKKGELLARAKVENDAKPKGLRLATPGPKGFVHVGKDGHFARGDGKRLFITGCNYIGSFATACRFCQDEHFDPRELEANLRMAKSAGVNAIRLFQLQGIAADLMAGDRRKLDTILELCRRNGIYVLLEASAGLSDTGSTMEETCAILERAAALLKDEPMLLGYDLRNEPTIAFVAGKPYPKDRKPAVHTVRLVDAYPEEAAEIKKLVETRPAWLKLSAAITGSDAENAIAAIHLWNKYTREFNLGSTTFGALPPEGLPRPAKWEPLVKAVDESYGLWIQLQKEAVRRGDPNHLISVGYNLVFAALPCNQKLDFVSHHVYGKPFSLAEVLENVETLDRLKKRFPSQPVSLGEFGYSTGIAMPASGRLDPETAAVGEMIHYLYAFAKDYEGCKKWMLTDWPIPVMQRYGSWNQYGVEGKRYEARFGLFAYDGSPQGRAKPIVHALKFLRDYADTTPPSGELSIVKGPLSIGAAYVYANKNALFVGNTEYASPRLSFKAAKPANVMLAWGEGGIRAIATSDAKVTLTPSAFGAYGTAVSGKHGGAAIDGKRLTLELLEGEGVTIK
ncbi:MAG: hypothetical protein J0L75_10810 [Spirochaetes bacterium]|nr:hypothetical protein [Spirochaetota bacterium]